ncbi:MAG: DUF3570 domain-containing protein [Gammaproteobacteria bacterium]
MVVTSNLLKGSPANVRGVAACLLITLWLINPAGSAVLPEDRADILLHSYDGGGVEVYGPTLLVRKGFRNNTTSLSLRYHRDTISGASPDVVVSASPYDESRDEYGFAVDYLFQNSQMSLGYTRSDESDYEANALNVGVSHEVFGAMTTVDLGFTRNFDTVSRSDGAGFGEDAVTTADIDRFQYRVGISQVITTTLLANLSYEAILDDGFLNSPYRFARVQGALVPERYPGTRTSHAVAVKARKYWQPRSSGYLGYRYFTDTWDIGAHTLEIGYSRYFTSRWLADFYYRYYTQDQASFYSDNFEQALNFVARDKELSSYSAHTFGTKFSYEAFDSIERYRLGRGTLNLSLELMRFDYDNYTDLSVGDTGAYSFDAASLHFFFSVLY